MIHGRGRHLPRARAVAANYLRTYPCPRPAGRHSVLFVDFVMRVPPYCQGAMPILPKFIAPLAKVGKYRNRRQEKLVADLTALPVVLTVSIQNLSSISMFSSKEDRVEESEM